MSISAIAGTQSYYTPTMSSTSQKQNTFQALQQLSQALQSGNLQGAQSAFATLQSGLPASLGGTAASFGATSLGATSATTATSGTSSTSNPIATDMQSLAQALQSGNLSAAQAAFAKLQQDSSSSSQVQGHHHHHHHGGNSSSSSTSSASTATTPASSGSSTSGASTLSLTA
jgi:hypothetical protein